MGIIRKAGYAPDTGSATPSWHRDAACRDIANADVIFFPHRTEQEHFGPAAALPYCNVCPVRLECLQAALEGNEFGTWGGMTHTDRLKLKGRLKGSDYATVEALRETLEHKFPECSDCGNFRKEKEDGRCAECHRAHLKVLEAEEAARKKAECSLPDCNAPFHAKGKCRRHYLVDLRNAKTPNSRNQTKTSRKVAA